MDRPLHRRHHHLAEPATIDHVVPLAEAHRSGAWRWDNATKNSFANDETPGMLLVVAGDINQSKADKTPDQWLPPDASAHCQYAIDWINSKSRYTLTVTAAESAALAQALDTCTPATVVRPAPDTVPNVVVTTPTTTTTTTIAPSAGPGVVALMSCDKRAEVVVIANTGGAAVSLSGLRLARRGPQTRSVTSASSGHFSPANDSDRDRRTTQPPVTAVWCGNARTCGTTTATSRT